MNSIQCRRCSIVKNCASCFEVSTFIVERNAHGHRSALCKSCHAQTSGQMLSTVAPEFRVEIEEAQKALESQPLNIVTPPVPVKRAGSNPEQASTVNHLKNILKGGAVFLLCGGPSLAQMDLPLLSQRGIVTMAINNAAALFRTNYWIGIDFPSRFAEQIWLDGTIVKLVPSRHFMRPLKLRDTTGTLTVSELTPRDCPNTYFFKERPNFQIETFLTDSDFSAGFKGRTSMIVALNMLYFLGARTVYIIGADFGMVEGQQNYAFPQDTSTKDVSSNNNIYRMMNSRFKQMKPHFDARSFQVLNCTPGGNLDAFDRFDYGEAVSKAKTESLCHYPINTSGMYPLKK